MIGRYDEQRVRMVRAQVLEQVEDLRVREEHRLVVDVEGLLAGAQPEHLRHVLAVRLLDRDRRAAARLELPRPWRRIVVVRRHQMAPDERWPGRLVERCLRLRDRFLVAVERRRQHHELVEALRVAEVRRQRRVRHERVRREAALGQDLRQRLEAVGEHVDRAPARRPVEVAPLRAVRGGQQARPERRDRRLRPRSVDEVAPVQRARGGDLLQARRRVPRVAADARVVGAQRVDQHDDDVRRRIGRTGARRFGTVGRRAAITRGQNER